MSESESLQTCRLYEFSVFTLDTAEGLFAGGEPVKLPPKVLQTLTLFVENPGRIITRNEFFDTIWADSFVEDGALSFNISRLRKALAEYDKDTEFIETVSKRGFRFLAEVRRVEGNETGLEILIERHELRELVHEEEQVIEADAQGKVTKPARSRLKPAVFVGMLILMLGAAAGYYRESVKNAKLESADDWSSVDLPISWRSAGSSGYAHYSSSHDGNMVAYSSTEDGASESIFVAQLVGGEKIRVTKDSWRNFSPIWSPNDRELAFASMRETKLGIYVCPAFGGPPRLIAEVKPADLLLRSWSRDGSAIFYEVKGNLFKLNITSGEVSQITVLPEVIAFRRNFSISTDEDRIAFCDETDGQKDLWTMPLNGGVPVRVTNNADEEFRSGWHPDGKRIFYSVLRKGHYQIDSAFLDGSDPVQITRGSGKYELIDISSNGTKIFYQRWLDKSDIWGVTVDNGEEVSVASDPESEFWPDVSGDGKTIVFQTNTAQYVQQEMIRSSVVVRALNEKRVLYEFAGFTPRWLPDKKRIGFLRWQETEKTFNLWIFDTVIGNESQVTFNGVSPGGNAAFPFHLVQISSFDWSPNSDRVVYVDFTKKNIWLASPGIDVATNITRSEDPGTTFRCPLWSPDGDRVAYISLSRPAAPAEKEIWSAWTSEEGNAREIFRSTKSLRFLGWSPDGDYLYFEAADGPIKAGFMNIELVRVSLKGDAARAGMFENISPLSMVMSHDRKNVAFISRADGRENIYTASTAQEGMRKITSNSDSLMRFGLLRWSPDGKTIFFDNQEETNMISMFQKSE